MKQKTRGKNQSIFYGLFLMSIFYYFLLNCASVYRLQRLVEILLETCVAIYLYFNQTQDKKDFTCVSMLILEYVRLSKG